MENLIYFINKINSDYEIKYTIIRTIITYGYAVILVRLGNTRFKLDTPMDYIFIVIIGAVLGRTIYGGASLLSTIISSFVLVVLHRIFAFIAFKNKKFGSLIKGKPEKLIIDGKIIWKNMQKNHITKDDLLEECRENINDSDLGKIKKAYLERNGKISFIQNK